MRVVATAGHVDHGKSTLIRALTGTDPDRWHEEHERGLTIDLGYAWMPLPSGDDVAFVDVPGHERFIANMLAGVGPVPAVMLVVAADEGWRRQSQEHLDAIVALGVRHGLLVVTRSDLADPASALAGAREHLDGTPLGGCEAVCVSGRTGDGLDDLRAALGRLCDDLPAPDPAADMRLWVDRVFTIRGAGTVVTGTLAAGTVSVGDSVEVAGRRVVVRGVHSLDRPREAMSAVARVALNLRGVGVDEVSRGDAVVAPGRWRPTSRVDVRLDPLPDNLPERAMGHVGTAAHEVRIRPFDHRHARITWPRALPLRAGDRIVLRDPGRQVVLCGAVVVDADPPDLLRRGDAARWAADLATRRPALDAGREVERRGWMGSDHLLSLGADPADLPPTVHRHGNLLVSPTRWDTWCAALSEAVDSFASANPLQARMPMGAAATAAGVPDTALVIPLAQSAGLILRDGHVARPGVEASLGPAEAGLAALEARLADHPFAAPERDDLAALGLGPREIAAAVRLGRLVDLGDQVVLGPSAPALAMRKLAGLDQPFTLSEARRRLETTRRVAVPLLELLDRRGWTRRVDASTREVVNRR
ncbi:MAG: selenocysteine-specific translation elongation factor [Propionibacterium sp.]|nr:selenocysteine-specific translation elongation factor [Propionibacterium sp.]